jgi:hypothetical protein
MSAEADLQQELTQLSIEMPAAGEAKGLYRTLPVTGNTTYTYG